MACQVGEKLGVTPAGTADRVREVLKRYGLPTQDRFTWGQVVEATALDKKMCIRDRVVIIRVNLGVRSAILLGGLLSALGDQVAESHHVHIFLLLGHAREVFAEMWIRDRAKAGSVLTITDEGELRLDEEAAKPGQKGAGRSGKKR